MASYHQPEKGGDCHGDHDHHHGGSPNYGQHPVRESDEPARHRQHQPVAAMVSNNQDHGEQPIRPLPGWSGACEAASSFLDLSPCPLGVYGLHLATNYDLFSSDPDIGDQSV